MTTYNIIVTVIIAVVQITCEPQTHSSTYLNSTSSILEDQPTNNSSNATTESRVSSLLMHLPTLKHAVVFICVVTAVLITCLLIQVYRSGRRIRKTRKYDIITTPAERVEMAPLNEEEEEEEESTLFDVKYR